MKNALFLVRFCLKEGIKWDLNLKETFFILIVQIATQCKIYGFFAKPLRIKSVYKSNFKRISDRWALSRMCQFANDPWSISLSRSIIFMTDRIKDNYEKKITMGQSRRTIIQQEIIIREGGILFGKKFHSTSLSLH